MQLRSRVKPGGSGAFLQLCKDKWSQVKYVRIICMAKKFRAVGLNEENLPMLHLDQKLGLCRNSHKLLRLLVLANEVLKEAQQP